MAHQSIPESFVVLALRNAVFYPRQVGPLSVGRERSLRVLTEVQLNNLPILILTQRNSSVENPKATDLHPVGTIVKILKVFNLPDGTKSILVQGIARARVLTFIQTEPFIKVVAQELHDEVTEDVEVEGFITAIKD